MQRHPINWERISKAVSFYTQRNYQYIEVPWLVSRSSADVTRPVNAERFEVPTGNLVASGEQSFIEIMDELCPNRKYQCVTPCFRDEEYDEMHHPYFVKNELIVVLWKTDDEQIVLKNMINDAYDFFRQVSYSRVVMAKTDIGTDIEMAGVEVGSYGIRSNGKHRWVYGTGCAEPRLSQAVLKCQQREDDEFEDLCDS
jgi:elongation factor P--beta-lysine ligase